LSLGDVGPQAEGKIFAPRPAGLSQLGASTGTKRIACAAAANASVLGAFQSGEVVRWFPEDEEFSLIDFGRDRRGEVSKILLEPKGYHALVTNNDAETWYLNINDNKAKALPKLKGHQIEAVFWDPDSTPTCTKDVLVGTIQGDILDVVIEGKEKIVRNLFQFNLGSAGRVPVCAIHRERVVSASDGSERTIVFAAAGCKIYAFVGTSFEDAFQRYQNDPTASRAVVFEVPRDLHNGEIQVDNACYGATTSRVLFWLTGVGVLTTTIKNPIESQNSVLESPPDVIPFPRPSKSNSSSRPSGSLIASLLPLPPPPAPLSMALTKYHIIFLFEDRWVAVSRISYEAVQTQEWSSSTYGGLRSLTRDLIGESLWVRTERHMFELVPEREDRHVWSLLLKLELFEDALRACRREPQRQHVLQTHADWLFRQGHVVESARKFAAATAMPFEHVALRFLAGDHKAALLEFLRHRLEKCPVEEKVTRSLLGVWAIEVCLAHLNEMKRVMTGARCQESVAAGRENLHELLLHECVNLEVQSTIYHLLQSHGWLEELTLFAEAKKDYATAIRHHVSRGDYSSAVKKLSEFQSSASEDLVIRFAPVLFCGESDALVSLLMRPQLSGLDPLSVLHAVYTPQSSAEHRADALRYLEHVMRHHPALVGQAPAAGAEGEAAELGGLCMRSNCYLLDSDFVNVGEETTKTTSGRGWANGTAFINALIVLYASDCTHGGGSSVGILHPGSGLGPSDPEDKLIGFLANQEGNPLLDICFAVRACSHKGLARAVVQLYGIMGMHEEAVEVALRRGDVVLAKHNAGRPADTKLRQKLWLRIVEDQATGGDVQTITMLIRESQELSFRDVLPHISNTMTIGAFQAEICECLDEFERQEQSLQHEMEDHRRALQTFKEEVKLTTERSVVVAEDHPCEICREPVTQERFYVFGCKHCFHEACLRALVLPTLERERRERLLSLEALRAAGSSSLAGVESELDGILADDCPMCGRLMVQSISRPFIDPDEEAAIESWAISA